jgi:hypothetical protein
MAAAAAHMGSASLQFLGPLVNGSPVHFPTNIPIVSLPGFATFRVVAQAPAARRESARI